MSKVGTMEVYELVTTNRLENQSQKTKTNETCQQTNFVNL